MILQHLPNKYNDLIADAISHANNGDDDGVKLAPNIVSAISFQ